MVVCTEFELGDRSRGSVGGDRGQAGFQAAHALGVERVDIRRREGFVPNGEIVELALREAVGIGAAEPDAGQRARHGSGLPAGRQELDAVHVDELVFAVLNEGPLVPSTLVRPLIGHAVQARVGAAATSGVEVDAGVAPGHVGLERTIRLGPEGRLCPRLIIGTVHPEGDGELLVFDDRVESPIRRTLQEHVVPAAVEREGFVAGLAGVASHVRRVGRVSLEPAVIALAALIERQSRSGSVDVVEIPETQQICQRQASPAP